MNIKTTIIIIILYCELDPEKICLQYAFFISVFLTTIEVLEKAMDEGYVSLNNIKMVICGPPAVGKTAFKDLLLGKSAPLEHDSTPIARPIQAIQITASTEDEDGEYMWKEASKDDLPCMLYEVIEKLGTTSSPKKESSITSDTPSPAHEAASPQEDTTSIEPPLEDTTAPVVSLPTAQASNDTTSEVTNPQQNSEDTTHSKDDNLLEECLKKLADAKRSKGSQPQKLLEATWIRFLDSGGQPQFTDLLPMFVRDNSLYIIVMKATESLHDKPKFVYSINDEPVRAPNDLTMTNLEIIENSVRSIVAAPRDKAAAAESSRSADNKSSNSKRMFVILATHIDKLQSEDVLDARLKEYEKILERLDKFRDHFIFYENESNKLIFPVNNLCDEDRQKKAAEIRKRLMSQSDEMSCNKEIPIRWYIFHILMKEEATKENGMISFQSCINIGTKIGMNKEEADEVGHCVQYLDSMRLCIYYPDVLPNVVFTSPQFLIDCLSKIVRVSFVDTKDITDKYLQKTLQIPEGASLSTEVIKSLQAYGVFDESLLDNLGLTFIDLFSKSDLLELLKHFNVISPIKANGDTGTSQYFMPILLPPERLTKEQKDCLEEKNDPLHITFKDKIFPKVSFIFSLSIYFSFYNTGFISNDGSVSIKLQRGALFFY